MEIKKPASFWKQALNVLCCPEFIHQLKYIQPGKLPRMNHSPYKVQGLLHRYHLQQLRQPDIHRYTFHMQYIHQKLCMP